ILIIVLLIFAVLFSKVPKTTKLFEFILDILSEPRYSSVISWEGTNGQFAIKRPDQVAYLWGERNGRTNMTYQKFSRALRYYYHKKVVCKIPGRNCVYKFNFPELEKQYGYHSSVIFPATTEPSGNRNSYEIPATVANHFQNANSEFHFPGTREFIGNDNYEIPASFHSLQHPNTANAAVAETLYSVRSPVVVRMITHESQSLLHSPSYPNPRYFHYC
ncbi:transcriptional regulator ERG homolog, partial [Orbicella faveolata]|uniref:transcriptional regulator ERG homolog n=1 Tax=Orbicella faveolata TaxID=48498 RepID=UPI0009E1F49E